MTRRHEIYGPRRRTALDVLDESQAEWEELFAQLRRTLARSEQIIAECRRITRPK